MHRDQRENINLYFLFDHLWVVRKQPYMDCRETSSCWCRTAAWGCPESTLLLNCHRYILVCCTCVLGRLPRRFATGHRSTRALWEALCNLGSRGGRCSGNLGLVAGWVTLPLLPHMIVMLLGLQVSCRSRKQTLLEIFGMRQHRFTSENLRGHESEK